MWKNVPNRVLHESSLQLSVRNTVVVFNLKMCAPSEGMHEEMGIAGAVYKVNFK